MNGPTAGTVPAHWIRRNEGTRLPRRHICLDVEANETDHGTWRHQTFRLAVASFDGQDRKGRKDYATQWGYFDTPADLWAWVDAHTARGRRTVVVAHNLAYDLRVSDAFRWLPALGWHLEMIRLETRQSWGKWRKGDRGLTMVDSMSWFGAALDTVGELVGIPKLDLPDWRDDDSAWAARCQRDVAILREAWHRVIRWVESDDLGNWKATGAGQGWAAFRHRWMTHLILHHDQPEVAAVEREAAWAGRCEAWRWGDLGPGPWWEMDFSAAYTRVAATVDVPTKLIGRISPSEARRYLRGVAGRCALLDCEVSTEVPTVPTRGPDGILWPVGTFRSWLWDIEAAEVVRDGGTVKIRGAYIYRSEPALQAWAAWILDQLDLPADKLDPVCRLVVKSWGRAVIGRFGARWGSWQPYGAAHGPDVALHLLVDGDAGTARRMLTLGATTFVEHDQEDAPDSAVHVMSYVMAVARCRMLAAMRIVGPDHLAYVDTDGLLVDGEGRRRLDAAQLPGLRVKAGYRKVEIMGPRQLVVDDTLRMAGIPKRARRTGRRTWAGEVWATLPGSLAAGESDAVSIHDRTWTVRGKDTRRAHLPGGRTAPLRMGE